MLLNMTEQQFKRWMIAKSRQYIWLILGTDPNRVKVSFMKKFEGRHKQAHGVCSKFDQHIIYRTDYIKNGWDCDLKVLENLIIHEVCHLKYEDHDGNFFTEYKKWSGDDFIGRWWKSQWDESLIDDKGKWVSNVVGLPKDELIGLVFDGNTYHKSGIR